ncbi:uncharacterized protein [Miscanthus floridulus]|uniref:uncharacterized protein n=1 Tax=Miscanthus floridulus TaxID=154761 RepID=UPI003458F0C9
MRFSTLISTISATTALPLSIAGTSLRRGHHALTATTTKAILLLCRTIASTFLLLLSFLYQCTLQLASKGSCFQISAFGLFNSLAKCSHEEKNMGDVGQLGEEGDIYIKLASLAPKIFGHEHVKKALLLVGAPHWTLAGGMKIRGDLHIC